MGNPWFQIGDHGLRPKLIAKMNYVTLIKRYVLRLSVSLASHSWPHRQIYLAPSFLLTSRA